MSIPIKEKCSIMAPQYKILTENFNYNLLVEELGAFKEQYSMAYEMAKSTIEMIRLHLIKKQFVSKNDESRWGKYEININYSEDANMLFSQTSAVFEGCSDNLIVLKLNLARHDVLSLTTVELEHKIAKIYAHELNHGYAIISSYNKRGDIPNYPVLYNQIVRILQAKDINPDGVLYRLAYAIYITSYIELPAFVSQTVPELKRILKDKTPSYDDFIDAVKNSEAYSLYEDILNRTLPMVRKIDSHNLMKTLKEYDIIVNKKELKHILDYIEINAKKGIKNIVRNSMIYYHEHMQQNNTDWFKTHSLKYV